MSTKLNLLIMATIFLVAGFLGTTSVRAQDTLATSLADQLKAQYKVAKIVPGVNSYKVDEPGTMLVVQKVGIVGVPIRSNSLESVVYDIQKDATLHHSPATAGAWEFEVGHKVYLTKVDIDAKRDKVLLMIVECDCGDPGKPLYYKAIVDFEFPKGYLAGAEAGQIESVIDQVLTVDDGGKATAAGPVDPGPTSCSANDEIIKLAQAKMPDSVVLTKIKSASCDFDTSTDALVKLKRAGASDAVLQAVMDTPPKPVAFSCSEYGACISSGNAALASSQWEDAITAFQAASTLDASKPEGWAGLGSTYLAAARKEEAPALWDKVLSLGGPLSFLVCRPRLGNCFSDRRDRGNLILAPKLVSFITSSGQKVFEVSPAEIISAEVAHKSRPLTRNELHLKAKGKNYDFYFIPIGIDCGKEESAYCEEDEAVAQQLAVFNYISKTIPKLASGNLGSSAP